MAVLHTHPSALTFIRFARFGKTIGIDLHKLQKCAHTNRIILIGAYLLSNHHTATATATVLTINHFSLSLFNFFAVLILTNINILEWLRIIETEWWKKAIWKRAQQPFVCPWLSFVICSFLRYSCYILLAIACVHSSISLLFISAVSFLPWYAVHATKVDAVLRLLLISWIYYCFCCCLSFSIFFVHI